MQRVRVTWIRDGKLGQARITHPWQWEVLGIDGVIRYFGTQAEALEHWATPESN